eukprot:GHVS01054666.1.p1 GENE.GHVS01054666.1~~GHVS01054666.1.p1  ORF type:complete len:145 (-),score=18.80 GHVS01054666.1:121-555(-)
MGLPHGSFVTSLSDYLYSMDKVFSFSSPLFRDLSQRSDAVRRNDTIILEGPSCTAKTLLLQEALLDLVLPIEEHCEPVGVVYVDTDMSFDISAFRRRVEARAVSMRHHQVGTVVSSGSRGVAAIRILQDQAIRLSSPMVDFVVD